MVGRFWGLVLARAWAETLALLGWNKALARRTVMVSTVGVGWTVVFGTPASAMSAFQSTLINILLANLVVVVGTLIVQIARAAALVYGEKEDKLIGGNIAAAPPLDGREERLTKLLGDKKRLANAYVAGKAALSGHDYNGVQVEWARATQKIIFEVGDPGENMIFWEAPSVQVPEDNHMVFGYMDRVTHNRIEYVRTLVTRIEAEIAKLR